MGYFWATTHRFRDMHVRGARGMDKIPPPRHNPDRPHALSPVHRPSERRPSVAGGLSVGPGSTVHVCGLTAVVVWVSGYTAPVCLLMVRGPVCIWSTRVSHVSTAVSATWVVYTQQTRRRVDGRRLPTFPRSSACGRLANRRAETATRAPPRPKVRFYSTFYL